MSTRKESIIKMLEETPNDEFLNYALALELEKEGKANEAIKILIDVKNYNPNYLGLYLKLAQLLAETNNTNDATNILQEGIIVAKSQNNRKAEGELNELLLGIED